MTSELSSVLFLVLLFVVAFLYASVGHGGASGYLALMSFYHLNPSMMKSSALMLNIIVSLTAFLNYSRTTKLNKRLFLLLIIGSVPAAFIGAGLNVDAVLYKKILALLLLFSVLRLSGLIKTGVREIIEPKPLLVIATGLLIGFVSGIIGIGGGILLSPLILFLGWADIRQTAVISSLFIFVNSISGMTGLIAKGISMDTILYLWIAVAVVGGFTGAYFGSRKFYNTTLKRILAIVLLIAGLKLLTDH